MEPTAVPAKNRRRRQAFLWIFLSKPPGQRLTLDSKTRQYTEVRRRGINDGVFRDFLQSMKSMELHDAGGVPLPKKFKFVS